MIHVYRVEEEKLHSITEENSTCHCGCRCVIDEDGDMVLVHSSLLTNNSIPDADAITLSAMLKESEGDALST
jgi:hypothetical protein